jgi:hypothetical protein
MKSSDGRILTTHMGSLPQAPELHARLMARAEGSADDKSLDADVQLAVAGCIRRQVESGVLVVNDGEQGKSSWAAYVKDRLNGLEGEDVPRPRPQDAATNGGTRRNFCRSCWCPACAQRPSLYVRWTLARSRSEAIFTMSTGGIHQGRSGRSNRPNPHMARLTTNSPVSMTCDAQSFPAFGDLS